MTEHEENPRIRPVGDLLKEKFFIPRYQRGYRWGKQEITELLSDILQYSKRTENRNEAVSAFYCLQPIVVKKKEWKVGGEEPVLGWELIDGQQRLTTIWIILKVLKNLREAMNDNRGVYTIDFETRDNCRSFFESNEFESNVDESNVDFYHISKAYQFIKEWFGVHLHQVEVLNTLLKSDYNVSVIWYEALPEGKADGRENGTEDDNTSIDLFTRLNDGKIPLTDAELIKALLLQLDLYPEKEHRFIKQRLFEIASEWDQVEATLQDPKMWLFVNGISYKPSSKIELLFKLLAEKWNCGPAQKLIQYDVKDEKPKHFEYLVFDRYLNSKRENGKTNSKEEHEQLGPVNEIWKEVKDIYSILCEWYDDHTYFHYVGLLIAFDDKNRDVLIDEALESKINKSAFVEGLKTKIAEAILIRSKHNESKELKGLDEIIYGKDDESIRRILLLFNVETLIQQKKENARFPFHLLKKDHITSIEHIHPQHPKSIDVDEERSHVWLRSHKSALELLKQANHEAANEIDEIINRMNQLLQNHDKELFKSVFSDTIDLYTYIAGVKESEQHTLYNLALVDKDTNSKLNNSFFDIKREILKENNSGKYIPVCTQRAFSKYYSKSPHEMIFWNTDDREAYFSAIANCYNSFINLLKPANGN
jgi:hypothetical protein